MIIMGRSFVPADQYSAMGNNRTDFEANYHMTEHGVFVWGSHCHDFYELYIHYQGGQYMGVNNDIYDMQPNELFIISPFVMHGLVVEQNLVNYERAFLYITSDALKRASCGQIDFDQFFQSVVSNGHCQFSIASEDAEKCKALMIRLQQNQQEERVLSRFRDYSLLLPLLDVICETVEQNDPVENTVLANNPIRDILVYINENFIQPIRVDELARRFGVSVSYLAHTFKKYTNRSVYDYVLYRRIMLAKKLIPGNESLIAISEQCGFDNYPNFLRHFYKYVGISPSAYKKSVK